MRKLSNTSLKHLWLTLQRNVFSKLRDSKNKNATYQKSWDIIKLTLKGKFIVLAEEASKALEWMTGFFPEERDTEDNQPKQAGRRKEIIEIRAESIKWEAEKQLRWKRIRGAHGLLNKIDKLPARNKARNKGKVPTTGTKSGLTTDLQTPKSIKKAVVPLPTNTVGGLGEVPSVIFENHKWPHATHLNLLRTIEEFNAIILKFSKTTVLGPESYIREF